MIVLIIVPLLSLGDGTGATICASSLLKLIDDDFSPLPMLQALICPATQALDLQTLSYQAYKDGPLLTQTGMAFNYILYTDGSAANFQKVLSNQHVLASVLAEKRALWMNHNVLPSDDQAKTAWKDHGGAEDENGELWKEISYIIGHQYFSPLLADKVDKMPDTYIAVSKQDVLRDDGVWFGEKLRAAGVKCHTELQDCIHGWTLFTEDNTTANEAAKHLVSHIKQKL